MNKFIQFLCLFFGLFLLTPTQASNQKLSLRQERKKINKQLKSGKRVLQIPNELFKVLIQELIDKGWRVQSGLGQYSNVLRDIYVGE